METKKRSVGGTDTAKANSTSPPGSAKKRRPSPEEVKNPTCSQNEHERATADESSDPNSEQNRETEGSGEQEQAEDGQIEGEKRDAFGSDCEFVMAQRRRLRMMEEKLEEIQNNFFTEIRTIVTDFVESMTEVATKRRHAAEALFEQINALYAANKDSAEQLDQAKKVTEGFSSVVRRV